MAKRDDGGEARTDGRLPEHFYDLSDHGLRLLLARSADGKLRLALVGSRTAAQTEAAQRLWFSASAERADVVTKTLLTDRDGRIRPDSIPSVRDVKAAFPQALSTWFVASRDLVELGPDGILGLPRHEPRPEVRVRTWADLREEGEEVLLRGRADVNGTVRDVRVRWSDGRHDVLYGNALQAVVGARSDDLRTALVTFSELAARDRVPGWLGTYDAVDPRIGEDGVPVLALEHAPFRIEVTTSGTGYVVDASSDLGLTTLGRGDDLAAIVRALSEVTGPDAPRGVAELPGMLRSVELRSLMMARGKQ